MGNTKILLHEEEKPTDASAYARQLQTLKDLLETMARLFGRLRLQPTEVGRGARDG